jgi:hypothetical protein
MPSNNENLKHPPTRLLGGIVEPLPQGLVPPMYQLMRQRAVSVGGAATAYEWEPVGSLRMLGEVTTITTPGRYRVDGYNLDHERVGMSDARDVAEGEPALVAGLFLQVEGPEAAAQRAVAEIEMLTQEAMGAVSRLMTTTAEMVRLPSEITAYITGTINKALAELRDTAGALVVARAREEQSPDVGTSTSERRVV